MINTERNVNGVGSGGTATAHDKQLAGALRKTALRDVQNENVGSIHKQQESLLPGGGGRVVTQSRFVGLNDLRLSAPRAPRVFHPWHIMDIPQKITQPRDSNLHHIPVATSNNLTATMAFPSNGLSVPSSFGKHSNNTPAAKVYPELPRTVDSKTTSDQLRTERFIRLQKFLKQCDEANQESTLRVSPVFHEFCGCYTSVLSIRHSQLLVFVWCDLPQCFCIYPLLSLASMLWSWRKEQSN
ncbi:hypothetical protein Sango_2780800 [Sesamum angolense]|uniref:Uncharacterized protein n=1 Tax=Sesamum angolense TaxID=2727404 RepID=A0AAE1T8D4_9LAMI|nr:hypothetical protein Sango_2780800 [Sesamum angolense]